MPSLVRSSLVYWPVAIMLARGIGLLLSWILRDLNAGDWWFWIRRFLAGAALEYVCYLLVGLTRSYFGISWTVSAAAVAAVTALQLWAVATIRRWAAQHGATMTALVVLVGSGVSPRGTAVSPSLTDRPLREPYVMTRWTPKLGLRWVFYADRCHAASPPPSRMGDVARCPP